MIAQCRPSAAWPITCSRSLSVAAPESALSSSQIAEAAGCRSTRSAAAAVPTTSAMRSPAVSVIVEQAAQLGEAPAQGAPGIVGDLPQQFAQLFAPHPSALHAQVGEQCARLLGWRQGQRPAIAYDAELSEESEFQRGHGQERRWIHADL